MYLLRRCFMTEHCSECTYLNLCNGDTCGKYWCSAKLERHAATEKNVTNFLKHIIKIHMKVKMHLIFLLNIKKQDVT